MHLVRLGRHRTAVERHPARLVNVARRIGNNLAIDRNAPVRHDRLGSAPRGDTRVREELGEAHARRLRGARAVTRVGAAARALYSTDRRCRIGRPTGLVGVHRVVGA